MRPFGALLVGSLRAMGTTLRNFFRPATTVQYPRVARPLPGQWRGGSFALTLDPRTGEENCIGCRLCEYICPSQIIRVSLRKGEKRQNGLGGTYCDAFSLDYQACMQCELCVQVCPTDAIVMTRSLHACTYGREGLFLSRERLFENGRRLLARPELASEATAARLQEWTDAARGRAEAAPVPAGRDAS
jgi:NADH-quinone oxidoreductase subunit I